MCPWLLTVHSPLVLSIFVTLFNLQGTRCFRSAGVLLLYQTLPRLSRTFFKGLSIRFKFFVLATFISYQIFSRLSRTFFNSLKKWNPLCSGVSAWDNFYILPDTQLFVKNFFRFSKEWNPPRSSVTTRDNFYILPDCHPLVKNFFHVIEIFPCLKVSLTDSLVRISPLASFVNTFPLFSSK